jgi:ABC-type antimicrobial peptide transport system permease subunit
VSTLDEPDGSARAREIRLSVVDDRYFDTMGIDVLAGRGFDTQDRTGTPETVVVNATMARTFWPPGTAVGQRLRIANQHRIVTVVGVVADGKYEDIDEPQVPFMYYALAQHYLNDVVAVVRVTPRGGPTVATLADALRRDIPHLAFGGLGLMSLDELLALPRFFSRAVAALIGAVCLVTLLLAMAGLYSSVFYSVNQRRQELIVRMLLGAGTKEILTIVIRRMAAVAVAGAVIGVAAATALLPAIASLFFGIRPAEPALAVSVAGAAISLVVVTAFTVVWPLTRQAPSARALHQA